MWMTRIVALAAITITLASCGPSTQGEATGQDQRATAAQPRSVPREAAPVQDPLIGQWSVLSDCSVGGLHVESTLEFLDTGAVIIGSSQGQFGGTWSWLDSSRISLEGGLAPVVLNASAGKDLLELWDENGEACTLVRPEAAAAAAAAMEEKILGSWTTPLCEGEGPTVITFQPGGLLTRDRNYGPADGFWALSDSSIGVLEMDFYPDVGGSFTYNVDTDALLDTDTLILTGPLDSYSEETCEWTRK